LPSVEAFIYSDCGEAVAVITPVQWGQMLATPLCRFVDGVISDYREVAKLAAVESALHEGSLKGGEYARVAEGNPSDANAGRIVDRVSDSGEHRFESRLPGSVGGKIGTIGIWIAVYQNDLDSIGNVSVAERLVRNPADACDFLRVELNLFVNSTAQPVQQRALDSVPQGLGIDDQTAVMRTHEALRPYVAGLAIHFDLGDNRNNCLPAG
jgi:hypothetical protein